jgi:cysteine desulfurase
MKTPIYLDYAATTPVDPRVAAAMQACLIEPSGWANPSSQHRLGRAAAARVAEARAQVASLIGADADEIVFTSGATESDNLALLGVARANADRGRHIVTSRTEHKAVLDPCRILQREGFEVSHLSPGPAGHIEPEALRAALRADTVLVSLMHVNNETGAINDISALGALCRARGVALHSDAAQSLGRLAIDVRELPVDFLSLTAHKIYGPKGVGALYVRRAARPLLKALMFGGGQERGLRPGTSPTHQIVGFGLACELTGRERDSDAARLAPLSEQLWRALEALGGVYRNGTGGVPHVLNVSFEDVEGESLVSSLGALAVATGSACNSASAEPSYVLRALGRSTRLAESSLRLSLGRHTTQSEIDFAGALICEAVERLRRVGPSPARWPRAVRRPVEGGVWTGAVADGVASAAWERWFEELPGAGALEAPEAEVLRGEAGGPLAEAWVRFHLRVSGEFVKDARFQASGCPHTLAVAAWLTEQLRGRSRREALRLDPQSWAAQLEIPTEKLGRLLVIEDALRATLQQWPGTP